jgi:hypothetical protein
VPGPAGWGQKGQKIPLLALRACFLFPDDKNAVKGRNTHGYSRNSILITSSAGQHQEVSIPEIPPVVGEL